MGAVTQEHEKQYCCSKCSYPFYNQYDRWSHQKICTDKILLDEPEPIEDYSHISYRELLERTAVKEPFYERYLDRTHFAEPEGMNELYRPKRKRSTV